MSVGGKFHTSSRALVPLVTDRTFFLSSLRIPPGFHLVGLLIGLWCTSVGPESLIPLGPCPRICPGPILKNTCASNSTKSSTSAKVKSASWFCVGNKITSLVSCLVSYRGWDLLMPTNCPEANTKVQ